MQLEISGIGNGRMNGRAAPLVRWNLPPAIEGPVVQTSNSAKDLPNNQESIGKRTNP